MDRLPAMPQLLRSHPIVLRFLLALATASAVAALRVDWTPRAGTAGLALGDIAPSDIRTERRLELIDEEVTTARRLQAREASLAVFEHDVLLARNTLQRIDRAFVEIRAGLAGLEQAPTPPTAPIGEGTVPAPHDGPMHAALRVEELQRVFSEELGVALRAVDLASLSSAGWSEDVQRDIKELVRVAMSDYVVLDQDRLPAKGAVTVIRLEGSERGEGVLDDPRAVRDLPEARDMITRAAQSDFSDRPLPLLDTMVTTARALTGPNLRFNASETEVRKEAAAAAVLPVTTTYQRGQVIVRSGEPILPSSLRVIEHMNAETGGYHPLLHHATATLVLALLLVLCVRFCERFVPGFHRRLNDLVAMAGLLLLVTGLAAMLAGVAGSSLHRTSSIPASAWAFAVPVAAGAMLLRTLMNATSATAWGVLAAIFCASVSGDSLTLGVFYVASALAAVGGLGGANERGRLIRAGLVAALVNVTMVLALDVANIAGAPDGLPSLTLSAALFHIIFALIGGVVSGVLAVGVAPLFEGLGFVTDSKLLELSNLNHPLLREMIVKAPGTYHHSMVVGSLAEAAAETIGANALLVRVGAYFHDIGKTLKPIYFIENQRDQENPHDRLSPSMSALVIISHVKEGIELGRKHKLPEPIIDMIPQHHGTSLVAFFYNKAVQQMDPGKGEVSDSDYRYPGPKPQTKEAAIMMMADGVEAATRSLTSHTQGAITARVEKMVNKYLAEGQLDECPLTLRDLHRVSETFVAVLLGIHHSRIEYPAPPGPKAAKRGRGLPASSITLELPPMTPNPDDLQVAPTSLERPVASLLPSDSIPPAPAPRGLPPARHGGNADFDVSGGDGDGS